MKDYSLKRGLKLNKKELEELIISVDKKIKNTDFIQIERDYSDLHDYCWDGERLKEEAEINKKWYKSYLEKLKEASKIDSECVEILADKYDLEFYYVCLGVDNKLLERKLYLNHIMWYGSCEVDVPKSIIEIIHEYRDEFIPHMESKGWKREGVVISNDENYKEG